MYTEECPYCGSECHCEWVDIGVGMAKCGPFRCDKCGACEIHPDDQGDDLSKEELKTGWYEPIDRRSR